MKDTNIEEKLNELVREFGGSIDPRHIKPATPAKQAQDNRKSLQKNINSLQESLDYLRICVKYQMFDLEATRRENKYLRKRLNEK